MSHAKAGRPLKLRHASLDDAPEICDIHRSYVDRWYRKLDNEQYEVPYSSLSLSERCGFERSGTMVELEATVKDYGVDVSPMPPPLNVWSFSRGMSMLLGRYQSSAFHLFELLHNDGIRHASILLASDDYYEVADKLDAAVKGSRSTLLHLI